MSGNWARVPSRPTTAPAVSFEPSWSSTSLSPAKTPSSQAMVATSLAIDTPKAPSPMMSIAVTATTAVFSQENQEPSGLKIPVLQSTIRCPW